MEVVANERTTDLVDSLSDLSGAKGLRQSLGPLGGIALDGGDHEAMLCCEEVSVSCLPVQWMTVVG